MFRNAAREARAAAILPGTWCLMTILLFLLALPVAVPAAAQGDSCPAVVAQALQITNENCADIGRNQACYGNVILEADPRSGVNDLAFEHPGDKVDITQVQRLRLHPMDVERAVWGIAMMRLQVDLPNTLPGQNVSILLFGDVELERSRQISIAVTALRNANIRSGPATSFPVVGGLASAQVVSANGRLGDNTWLRVELPDSQTGWVFGELVTAESAIDTLAIVDPSEPPASQGFYFRTGIGDAPCEEAPNSGILIQTPEGVGEVTLTINEVNIHLSSTAYLQAEPGEEMRVNLVEGRARIEAFGVEQIALAGTSVRVPIDNQLAASGPPRPPQPCVVSDMRGLPVESWSCDVVEVHLGDYFQECPAVVPAGMDVLVSWPHPTGTEEQIDAAVASQVSSIEIDGQSAAVWREKYAAQVEGMFGYDTRFYWNSPQPGTHLVRGSSDEGNVACTITVLSP